MIISHNSGMKPPENHTVQ